MAMNKLYPVIRMLYMAALKQHASKHKYKLKTIQATDGIYVMVTVFHQDDNIVPIAKPEELFLPFLGG
jgi:hypothetical protein